MEKWAHSADAVAEFESAMKLTPSQRHNAIREIALGHRTNGKRIHSHRTTEAFTIRLTMKLQVKQ